MYQYETDLKEIGEAIGADPRAKSAKELLSMKKSELLKGFEEAKEKLKKAK